MNAREELEHLRRLPLILSEDLLTDGLPAGEMQTTQADGKDQKLPTVQDKGIWSELQHFLEEWRSPSPTLCVSTSGSTGTPKILNASKACMANSARRTCAFLQIPRGATSLLAMPLRYIAGKMVVVRALLEAHRLVVVEPSSSPLLAVCANGTPAPYFAALTPMQAFESLKSPETANMLRDVHDLLLGGGAVSGELADALASFPNAVWSSYGMTETLSHIALRRVNGPQATDWFTPLAGVRIFLTPEGTLQIEDPATGNPCLITNDLAEIDAGGRFRILGRRDNVINTGGIKVQIEDVENALRGKIAGDFCITCLPDERLGQKITLLATAAALQDHAAGIPDLLALCRSCLPEYWRPRSAFIVDTIPRTETGKPAREKAKDAALQMARVTRLTLGQKSSSTLPESARNQK